MVAAISAIPGRTDLAVPDLVRYVRVELGLTQSEFGALLGVRYETISSWENDHTVPPLFKQRLIEAAFDAVDRRADLRGQWNISRSLKVCGPAWALWQVLNEAYRA